MEHDIFINPYTDFGFKRLFGTENNKDILIDFLNELLREEEGEIREISFIKNEQIGSYDGDRKAIFDISCENERGEKFIVEMQKAKQLYFKDRSIFYSTFPIREQAKRGNWNYELKKVYTIAILDFEFEEDKLESDPNKVLHYVKLLDVDTKKVFYDKLTFVYLTMPKFNKELIECVSHFDKWMYVLKNLTTLTSIPESIESEGVFKHLFEEAKYSKLSKDEQMQYEDDLKIYRDMVNVISTAKIEGIAEGIAEGIEKGIEQGIEKGIEQGIEQGIELKAINGAKKMLERGFSIDDVIEITELPIEQIKILEKEISKK